MPIITYLLIGSVVFALLLTYFLARKPSKKGGNTGLLEIVFLGVVLGFVSVISIPIFFGSVNGVYNLTVPPKYQATVVDMESKIHRSTYRDDYGKNRTRSSLLTVPIVRFVDANGQTVTQKINTYRVSHPKIGDVITVSYNGGNVYEVSPYTFVITFLALLFSSFGIYFLLSNVFDALGKEESRAKAATAAFFFKGLIPLSILGLFVTTIIPLGQALLGYRDMSNLAYVLSLVFVPVLGLILRAYVKGIVLKK